MYAKQNKERVTNTRPNILHDLDCPNKDLCQIENIPESYS